MVNFLDIATAYTTAILLGGVMHYVQVESASSGDMPLCNPHARRTLHTDPSWLATGPPRREQNLLTYTDQKWLATTLPRKH